MSSAGVRGLCLNNEPPVSQLEGRSLPMAPLRRQRHSCQNILRLSTNICSVSCKQRFVSLKLGRHNTGQIGTEQKKKGMMGGCLGGVEMCRQERLCPNLAPRCCSRPCSSPKEGRGHVLLLARHLTPPHHLPPVPCRGASQL